MANVNIKFNGKEYLLSCDDGQENNLRELALNLNKRFNEIKLSLGNIGESKLLLISSIKIIDDYHDLLKKIDKKKEEFNQLSEKFKELKSLVIGYKDDKELEINKLKQDLDTLKMTFEENKATYEKMLDKATTSIEDFIESSSKDKSLQ